MTSRWLFGFRLCVNNNHNVNIFRYRLSNASYDGSFAIDAVSGELRTSGPIDREQRTSHRLTLIAENVEYQLSSSADVIVRVVDLNDNEPTLRRPETICVSRFTSRGQTVGRLEATDVDEGLNAVVRFSWINHDEVRQIRANTSSTMSRSTTTMTTGPSCSISRRTVT